MVLASLRSSIGLRTPPTLSRAFLYTRPSKICFHLPSYNRSNSIMASSDPPAASLVVPEGYTLHTENSSSILLPSDNGAFLNPVQEFNRDLSVACINTWGELVNEEKRRRLEAAEERARAKRQKSASGGGFLSWGVGKGMLMLSRRYRGRAGRYGRLGAADPA
jgi:hypothetical protein